MQNQETIRWTILLSLIKYTRKVSRVVLEYWEAGGAFCLVYGGGGNTAEAGGNTGRDE